MAISSGFLKGVNKINSWYHAKASAKKYGGHPNQYIDIHEFIDSSKRIVGDVRHRSMYHHTEGVWLCQRIFGRTIQVGGKYVPQEINYITENTEPSITGPNLEIIDYGPIREIPVRLIAELHIMQDLGWIPSPSDYIKNMELQQWMGGPIRKEQNLDSFIQVHPQEIDIQPQPQETQIQPQETYLDKKPVLPITENNDFFDYFFKRNSE